MEFNPIVVALSSDWPLGGQAKRDRANTGDQASRREEEEGEVGSSLARFELKLEVAQEITACLPAG